MTETAIFELCKQAASTILRVQETHGPFPFFADHEELAIRFPSVTRRDGRRDLMRHRQNQPRRPNYGIEPLWAAPLARQDASMGRALGAAGCKYGPRPWRGRMQELFRSRFVIPRPQRMAGAARFSIGRPSCVRQCHPSGPGTKQRTSGLPPISMNQAIATPIGLPNFLITAVGGTSCHSPLNSTQ